MCEVGFCIDCYRDPTKYIECPVSGKTGYGRCAFFEPVTPDDPAVRGIGGASRDVIGEVARLHGTEVTSG